MCKILQDFIYRGNTSYILPIYWTKSFSIVLKKFYNYVDKNVYSANEAILIRGLFIKQGSRDFSFSNIDELNEMVILLSIKIIIIISTFKI